MAAGCACAALLLCAVALFGYLAHVPVLYAFEPGSRAMSPLTAMGLGMLAVGQIARFRGGTGARAGIVVRFGPVATAISLAILASHAVLGHDALSPAFARAVFGPLPVVGATSIATALCMGLLGLGTLPAWRDRPAVSDPAAAASLLPASLVVIGSFYGADDLYLFRPFHTMALNTAMAIAMLACAAILGQAQGGWARTIALEGAGGGAVRRQLLFAAVPPLVGFVLAETGRHDRLSVGTAMALLVVLTLIPLLWLVMRDGRALAELDRERAHRAAIEATHLAALEAMNASLEQRVEAAMAEREQAQAALRQSQKMEAMGQLTGGVAHDFNNLLTPIMGALDMIARRGPVDAREKRLVDGAIESADRARMLVQRLLAFARRQPLQPGPVDVAALVTSMGALVSSTLGARIRVVLRIAEDLPAAQAETNQLEMAILNLSVNARDAMPDGGDLTLSATAVDLSDRRDVASGRYVRITVCDTGTGMDETTLKRATEPFYSTKGIGKGTGLGLSMVHGLAAQLGGTLDIDSTPGLGTRIDLYLPVAIGALPDSPLPGRAARPVPADMRGRALLVDDEDLVRMTTADMVGEMGYAITEAASASEALVMLDRGLKVDLVVTDHLMPGMTGSELARNIRRRWPGMPVLLVSGYADVEGVLPDLPRLTKPFRQSDLAEAISELTPG